MHGSAVVEDSYDFIITVQKNLVFSFRNRPDFIIENRKFLFIYFFIHIQCMYIHKRHSRTVLRFYPNFFQEYIMYTFCMYNETRFILVLTNVLNLLKIQNCLIYILNMYFS